MCSMSHATFHICWSLWLLVRVTCSYEDDFLSYQNNHIDSREELSTNYNEFDGYFSTSSTTLKPFIDKETPTNVTVIKGKTAMLACVVKNLGTASVSWMRIRDLNVLTMNELTNTKDPRIKAIHIPKSNRWALRIQDTKVEDSGDYECQVTTAKKTIEIITLNVLDPITTILGPKEVFLSKGSTLNLTCVISRGPQTQPFIIWTHNSKMLQYLTPSDSKSSLHANANGDIITQILVAETAVSHSGKYKCEPGSSPSDHVTVHVLDGKLPAAMQRAGLSNKLDWTLLLLTLLIQLIFMPSRNQSRTSLSFLHLTSKIRSPASPQFHPNLTGGYSIRKTPSDDEANE